jgi:hypothetical protein
MSNCPVHPGVPFHRERQNAGYCKLCDDIWIKKGWILPKRMPSQAKASPAVEKILSVKTS